MKNSIFILYLICIAACNKTPKTTKEHLVKDKTPYEIFTHRDKTSDGIIFFSSNNGLTWKAKAKDCLPKVSWD